MMKFNKAYKRGLALFLSLVMALALAMPGLAAENPRPLPDLEEATDVVPEDSPYKEPYEEAKEADKLVDEDLEEVNSQIKIGRAHV